MTRIIIGFVLSFVIGVGSGAEGAEDRFEVVFVFQADVLFDERDAGGGSIVRNGYGGHGHL